MVNAIRDLALDSIGIDDCIRVTYSTTSAFTLLLSDRMRCSPFVGIQRRVVVESIDSKVVALRCGLLQRYDELR